MVCLIIFHPLGSAAGRVALYGGVFIQSHLILFVFSESMKPAMPLEKAEHVRDTKTS